MQGIQKAFLQLDKLAREWVLLGLLQQASNHPIQMSSLEEVFPDLYDPEVLLNRIEHTTPEKYATRLTPTGPISEGYNDLYKGWGNTYSHMITIPITIPYSNKPGYPRVEDKCVTLLIFLHPEGDPIAAAIIAENTVIFYMDYL